MVSKTSDINTDCGPGPNIAMSLSVNQVTHLSLPLTASTYSDTCLLSTGHKSCPPSLILSLSPIHLLPLTVPHLPSASKLQAGPCFSSKLGQGLMWFSLPCSVCHGSEHGNDFSSEPRELRPISACGSLGHLSFFLNISVITKSILRKLGTPNLVFTFQYF